MYYVVLFNSRSDFALFYEFIMIRVWPSYKERVRRHRGKDYPFEAAPYEFIKLTEWNGRRFWKFKNLRWAKHMADYGLTVRQWNPEWGDANTDPKRYVFKDGTFRRVK